MRLHGYRLPQPGVRVYQPILPQGGLHASRVLGLDLRLEGTRLRFFHGAAAIPDANELISSLERMIDDVELRVTVAEDQARAAEERADQEARLRAEAERRLAEALEELERLKSERSRS